jgi:hypothetical protein
MTENIGLDLTPAEVVTIQKSLDIRPFAAQHRPCGAKQKR